MKSWASIWRRSFTSKHHWYSEALYVTWAEPRHLCILCAEYSPVEWCLWVSIPEKFLLELWPEFNYVYVQCGLLQQDTLKGAGEIQKQESWCNDYVYLWSGLISVFCIELSNTQSLSMPVWQWSGYNKLRKHYTSCGSIILVLKGIWVLRGPIPLPVVLSSRFKIHFLKDMKT